MICLGKPASSHLDNDKDYMYKRKRRENKCERRRELDLHMDLFWSADGQCLGEASDMPMTSERGGGDDDDNGDSIIQNHDSYE